jgi:integrase
MQIKPNYFSQSPARTSVITRSDGKTYTLREDKMRFFFPDEFLSFYDNLREGKQKVTFRFLISTGARINEVRHIKVGDIDFNRQSIIIKHTKSRNKDGTKKIRVIVVSSQFAKWLKAIIKKYGLQNDDVFPILSTPAANIAMQNALRKTKIRDRDNFSVHSVRKTTEVWMMSLDIDSLKVAKHVGHTIAIAEKYYVSPDTFNFEDKKNMRDVIGDLYQK